MEGRQKDSICIDCMRMGESMHSDGHRCLAWDHGTWVFGSRVEDAGFANRPASRFGHAHGDGEVDLRAG